MTNRIEVRESQEFMSDYKPVYKPIYPLFMKGARAHSEVVGTMDFKRLGTVGDIRSRHFTPKDTEIKQIAVSDSKKTFKKYFFAGQYTQSEFQDQEGIEEIVARVLDEHHAHQDDLFLLGDSATGLVDGIENNGLFLSADPNYTLEASIQIKKGITEDHLKDLHSKIMATVSKSDNTDGEKLLLLYGDQVTEKYDSLYVNSDAAFKTRLQEVLGANVTVAKMPKKVTPAGTNGWIMSNLDQIKTHYTALPQLKRQGVNEEKMYSWHNFLMGSIMLEVLLKDAVIRQPVTFES